MPSLTHFINFNQMKNTAGNKNQTDAERRNKVANMKTTILFLILLLALSALASWERTFGGSEYDYGFSVEQTSDGGYIIAGKTSSFGADSGDVYLVKTDDSGDTVWTRTYGGSSNDYGESVAQTSDGGYIVAGVSYSYGAGGSDVYLIKTDAEGDTIWTRTYGGSQNDYGYSVAQTADGGYIVAGYTASFGEGSYDVYLVKTDDSGDTVWTRTYGGSGYDVSYSVAQTADGGYILAGGTDSYGAGQDDVYLIKTDADGDSLWTRTYGGSVDDCGYSVSQSGDGGYIVAGWTHSFGAGSADVYIVKTDGVGDTIWTRTYGGSGYDVGLSISQTSDGGSIITGYTNSFGAGSYDVYLVKTDAVGVTMWSRTYGGSVEDYGFSVTQTSDDGYIITGRTNSFGAGGLDIYLIKTDSLGYAGIEESSPYSKPEAFALSAYPNPFNSAVTISLSCHSRAIGNPEIEIYDINGRRVENLSVGDGFPVPSSNGRGNLAPTNIIWQPSPSLGSGVYLVRATVGPSTGSGTASVSKRIVYLK